MFTGTLKEASLRRITSLKRELYLHSESIMGDVSKGEAAPNRYSSHSLDFHMRLFCRLFSLQLLEDTRDFVRLSRILALVVSQFDAFEPVYAPEFNHNVERFRLCLWIRDLLEVVGQVGPDSERGYRGPRVIK